MNNAIVKKAVYHFQDLVVEKRVKTFSKFLGEVYTYFNLDKAEAVTYKFIYKELKNIHTFLKEIQHHPNSFLLAQALKPTFIFLLNNFIIPRVVIVRDFKFLEVSRIRYVDLIMGSLDRRITQLAGDIFLIPYKGKPLPPRLCNTQSFAKRRWVSEIVITKVLRGLVLTHLSYGRVLFNPDGLWSAEKKSVVSRRLADHYLHSDSEFFPLELFEFDEGPDVPEGW